MSGSFPAGPPREADQGGKKEGRGGFYGNVPFIDNPGPSRGPWLAMTELLIKNPPFIKGDKSGICSLRRAVGCLLLRLFPSQPVTPARRAGHFYSRHITHLPITLLHRRFAPTRHATPRCRKISGRGPWRGSPGHHNAPVRGSACRSRSRSAHAAGSATRPSPSSGNFLYKRQDQFRWLASKARQYLR